MRNEKNVEKWPFLDQNHGLTSLEKCKFFLTFRSASFLSLERHFFVLEYRKRHFPGLYYLGKKVGKMAIFGQKPWVIPLGKMSIFRRFELLFVLDLEGVFRSRIS